MSTDVVSGQEGLAKVASLPDAELVVSAIVGGAGLVPTLAAIRSKKGYLHGQFLRLRARCGAKKAICAVAASILTAAYHMLKDGTFYQDLGAAHFDRRRPEAHARRLVKRLAELGFCVELKPVAATA